MPGALFGALPLRRAGGRRNSWHQPTTAVAEVTQTGTDGKTVKTEYDTLEAALKAAQSSSFATNSGTSSTVQSAEVTLLADINDTITVSTIYPNH